MVLVGGHRNPSRRFHCGPSGRSYRGITSVICGGYLTFWMGPQLPHCRVLSSSRTICLASFAGCLFSFVLRNCVCHVMARPKYSRLFENLDAPSVTQTSVILVPDSLTRETSRLSRILSASWSTVETVPPVLCRTINVFFEHILPSATCFGATPFLELQTTLPLIGRVSVVAIAQPELP
ncbi:unnamed protein product, partial [Ectocarpus sp. 4 AP-2014]